MPDVTCDDCDLSPDGRCPNHRASKYPNLDAVLNVLDGIDHSKLRREVEVLRAIQQWALDQLPIAAGDRVTPTVEIDRNRQPGWWHYREALAPGQPATVREIRFDTHLNCWYAQIVLDREWSCHDVGTPREARYWNGPVEQTPDGYEAPSMFDQQRYPDGRHHLFSFDIQDLNRVDGEVRDA